MVLCPKRWQTSSLASLSKHNIAKWLERMRRIWVYPIDSKSGNLEKGGTGVGSSQGLDCGLEGHLINSLQSPGEVPFSAKAWYKTDSTPRIWHGQITPTHLSSRSVTTTVAVRLTLETVYLFLGNSIPGDYKDHLHSFLVPYPDSGVVSYRPTCPGGRGGGLLPRYLSTRQCMTVLQEEQLERIQGGSTLQGDQPVHGPGSSVLAGSQQTRTLPSRIRSRSHLSTPTSTSLGRRWPSNHQRTRSSTCLQTPAHQLVDSRSASRTPPFYHQPTTVLPLRVIIKKLNCPKIA